MSIRQRFKNAIKRGTGETYLLLKDNPKVDFSNEIIKAALENLSYDNQCENRDEYVFGLIELSAQKKKIKQVIFQALSTGNHKDWDFYQLCNIVRKFAQQGEEEARKAIFKRYYSDPRSFCQYCGDEVIVELDGMEGLKRIAEVQGQALLENADLYATPWIATAFQEHNPNINVHEELADAAKTNRYIKEFLKAMIEDKGNRPKRKREKYSYETISKRLAQNQTVYVADKRTRELTKTDVRKLADDLLKQTDRKKIAAYLSIFTTVKFPYDYHALLKYVQFENMQNKKWRSKNWDMLVKRACDALKFFSGTDIRKLALEKLNEIRCPYEYMSLLVKNYKKGDAKLLTDIVMRCKNDDEIHSVACGIIKIYEAQKAKECKEPLESIYDRMNCGSHRKDIVEILLKNSVLPDKLKREIQFDSEEDTRKLYAGLGGIL